SFVGCSILEYFTRDFKSINDIFTSVNLFGALVSTLERRSANSVDFSTNTGTDGIFIRGFFGIDGESGGGVKFCGLQNGTIEFANGTLLHTQRGRKYCHVTAQTIAKTLTMSTAIIINLKLYK